MVGNSHVRSYNDHNEFSCDMLKKKLKMRESSREVC